MSKGGSGLTASRSVSSDASHPASRWLPIEEAPRGSFRTTPSGKGREKQTFVPDRVLTWKDGDDWRVSWFLPDGVEGAKDGARWCFYTKDAPPTHFMPVEPPQ